MGTAGGRSGGAVGDWADAKAVKHAIRPAIRIRVAGLCVIRIAPDLGQSREREKPEALRNIESFIGRDE
jgi:hypothetical protein